MVLVGSTRPWVMLPGGRRVSLWELPWAFAGDVGAAGGAGVVLLGITLAMAVLTVVWPRRAVVGGVLLCGGSCVLALGWILAELAVACPDGGAVRVTVAPDVTFTGVVLLVAGVGVLRLVDVASGVSGRTHGGGDGFEVRVAHEVAAGVRDREAAEWLGVPP
ncbi:hypothetical protein GCM10009677_28030 [Sphaerisporangium rubeum]